MDLGASNHMTGHGEWFKEMQTHEKPNYVETRDDTTYAIVHTGNVPLTMHDGKVKYLVDELHVPSIKRTLSQLTKWLSRDCRSN